MAKGNFTGKGYFQPGKSGNPKGKPKMDPELKAMRQRSRSDMEAMTLKLLNFTEPKLEELLKGPELNLCEKFIARFILRGISKGDQAAFMQISDYVFGKRPETSKVEMDMKSSDGSMTPQVKINIIANGREAVD